MMMVENSGTMAHEKSIISRSHNFLGTGDEEEHNEKGILDQHVPDECVEKFSGRMKWDGEGFNKRAFLSPPLFWVGNVEQNTSQ